MWGVKHSDFTHNLYLDVKDIHNEINPIFGDLATQAGLEKDNYIPSSYNTGAWLKITVKFDSGDTDYSWQTGDQ